MLEQSNDAGQMLKRCICFCNAFQVKSDNQFPSQHLALALRNLKISSLHVELIFEMILYCKLLMCSQYQNHIMYMLIGRSITSGALNVCEITSSSFLKLSLCPMYLSSIFSSAFDFIVINFELLACSQVWSTYTMSYLSDFVLSISDPSQVEL